MFKARVVQRTNHVYQYETWYSADGILTHTDGWKAIGIMFFDQAEAVNFLEKQARDYLNHPAPELPKVIKEIEIE